MKNIQSTRRKFLSSLAILSACAPFASAADFFSDRYSTTDLPTQWKFFYSANGGEPFDELLKSEYEPAINQCSGHSYKTGELIYFPKENIMAQPTWVYWGKEKSKPADVIIAFFYNNPGKKKVFSINRFELQGMCVFSEAKSERSLISLLCEASQHHHSSGHEHKLKIKTHVNKGDRIQILASLSSKDISITKKLIYNA